MQVISPSFTVSYQVQQTAPISVIIPTADRAVLVIQAIQSVIRGELLPRELIVVLSPVSAARTVQSARRAHESESSHKNVYPEYAGVCQKLRALALNFPFLHIKLLFCPRSYAAAARNMGACWAQQPWLAFLDSDDLWTPSKLLCQWQYLQQRPHLYACHTAEKWLQSGRSLTQPSHLRARGGRFLQAAFEHCLISCSALCIQKRVFFECGAFDESFEVCEDFAFFLRYLCKYPIGFLPAALTIKRAGAWPQLSKRYHSLDMWRMQALLDFHAHHWKELNHIEHQALTTAIRHKFMILQKGARKHNSSARLRTLQARMITEAPLSVYKLRIPFDFRTL